MRKVKKIFLTTIALTLTSFMMKTVGVWFNVYLTGLVGTVGIGIFQLIMSVYAMAKTLSYGGMNLAATRLCIDHYETRRDTMKKMFITSVLIGLFGMILLYTFSDVISQKWILSYMASPSLKILSYSLPFVAVSAAFNGYMTAARKMSRYSLIQLLEQVAKIALTVYLTKRSDVFQYDSIALICFAITISEILSFSLSLIFYRLDVWRERAIRNKFPGFIKRMMRIAVPDAMGAYVRSALNTVEHLLIPKGIRRSGASTEKALSDYGVVQGMALPVLLYPSSILGVLSGLLVPEIAECKLKKNEVQSNYMINRVLHITMIFSMLVTSVMLIFANELSEQIYGSDKAAVFIRLIAPLIPIMYLDMTTDGMLKGLDLQLSIMKINIIDSVLCVVLVWFLVPKVALEGYIITIYIAEIVNFLLSFSKLSKESKIRFIFTKNFLLPLSCAFASAGLSHNLIISTSSSAIRLTVAILISSAIYYFLLRMSGGITKDDSRWFFSLFKPS